MLLVAVKSKTGLAVVGLPTFCAGFELFNLSIVRKPNVTESGEISFPLGKSEFLHAVHMDAKPSLVGKIVQASILHSERNSLSAKIVS